MATEVAKSPIQQATQDKDVAETKKYGKTPRRVIDSLETSLANCAMTQFKAAFLETDVRVSGPAAAVLGDIVNKVAQVVVGKAVEHTSLANKKMLSEGAIKIGAQTCAPSTISSGASQAWSNIFESKKQWAILDGWTRTIQSIRAAASQNADAPPTRINDILSEYGHHIKPTVMKRLLTQILAKRLRLGGDKPAIALCIVTGIVIEIIARSVKMDRDESGIKGGFIAAPKHIIRAIQSNEVLRNILGSLNMVGAPVGLLDHAQKRKRRASRAIGPVNKRARRASPSPKMHSPIALQMAMVPSPQRKSRSAHKKSRSAGRKKSRSSYAISPMID